MTAKYIVIFQDSAPTEQINMYMHQIHEEGGSVTNRYPDMIARGFTAHVTDPVLDRLRSDSDVAHVTPEDSSDLQSSFTPYELFA